MSKRIVVVICGFLWASISGGLCLARQNDVPKNIILMIGDGMGFGHITAAKTVKGKIGLEEFKTVGLLTTHSDSNYVTDSAAAGTALATGKKTINGAISTSVRKKPLKTVLEWAEQNGKSTGLVVTCSVTHATPAVFVAHVDSRKSENEIAEQIANSSVDVLFGGGLGYFMPKHEQASKRTDEKDLLSKLRARMQVATSAKEFRCLELDKPAAALLATEHPPKADKREVSLAEMTSKALQILSKDKDGFFLMVEGSQIDWAAHNNDPNYLIAETVDFDEAVKVALRFSRQNKDTLVIVTADHETGGFAPLTGSVLEHKVTKAGFLTKNHTGVMVPVFAYGPGSYIFGGIHDNTKVGRTIIRYVRKTKRANDS